MEDQDMQDKEISDMNTDDQKTNRPCSTASTKEPLPTDSMVTVRLSDSSIGPALHGSTETTSPQNILEIEALKESHKSSGDIAEEGNSHATGSEETKQENARDSLASMTSVVEEDPSIHTLGSIRSRSSSDTSSSSSSVKVDWEELEKSEEQAPRDEGSDESTAFLLARLEQENNALATNPKAGLARVRSRKGTKGRPPSFQQLKKLVNEPTKPSLRYSMVPDPPPMTELEFWAALVNDYPQTAQRLPTLTSNKIRGGVPPPLRGVVWMSIAGSRDLLLEQEYDRLCGETSPYENLIGKDIGRSFPGVEMFRDPSGEGQQMLARVLKAFSLYDHKIGYCQGLGFVVGPLVMHMADKEAFCVLVRLMEHYDLRSCFLPDLSGLHLRIYQFQDLLSKHLPTLAAHLEELQIEPLYVSQWFLSFFAVTCPLPMLLRIYDVILTEGASETLMRVALSLMRRNESKIRACTEMEDVMGLLLSRALWDTYGCDADDLVNDFIGLTGLVTRDRLETLERSFNQAANEDIVVKIISLPNVQAAASRFLGRFWTGSGSSAKTTSPTSSLGVAALSRPTSLLQRTPSKQSMASTLNSIESSDSQLSASSTEATAMSRNPSADCTPVKSVAFSNTVTSVGVSREDRDLHTQIEDLLTALGDMQREQAELISELQKEREGREEDRAAVQRFVDKTRAPAALDIIPENRTHHSRATSQSSITVEDGQDAITELTDYFTPRTEKRSSLAQQSKFQIREELKLWKDQYDVEILRAADLSRQLADEKAENARVVEHSREMRTRFQEVQQDKQRLEKTIHEARTRRYSTESDFESVPSTPVDGVAPAAGLRELKLARSGSITLNSAAAQPFAKRSSSLGISKVLSTEDHKPPSDEALLLELVNAKTAEAVARQECEEAKAKLESLRKMIGGGPSAGSGHRPSASDVGLGKLTSPSTTRALETPKLTPPSVSSAGGFFSAWGKRTASNPAVTVIPADS